MSTHNPLKHDNRRMHEVSAWLPVAAQPICSADLSLRNICTGTVADSSVNADSAKEVGESILQHMAGKKVTEYKFKKKVRHSNGHHTL